MHVLVMGAGVVGVTTAWYLRENGHEVTVVDRQNQPAVETSFANGGQISVSHAEPWANPSAPLKVLRWLAKSDAPLLFRPRADIAQWKWCLGFLWECLPHRTAKNIRQIVSLGLYSRQRLDEMRRTLNIEYDARQDGILHFYTDEREFRNAMEPARIMRDHGCDIDIVSPDDVIRIEPALRSVRTEIVGGMMTPSDESGDACMFTRALARRAHDRGVRFCFNTNIVGFEIDSDSISGLRIRNTDGGYDTLRADAYVTCLGSYSRPCLAPLGINLSIYPAKGYSVTLPIKDPSKAYSVSLTDDEHKLVFSRLGNRLRIAGTAELSGYSLDLNPIRCAAIMRRVFALFPGVADPADAIFWTGLRPATPSNVPYVGNTKYRNLYLNTGHGTLGWTHSCGSAKAIAGIIDGRPPDLDFNFSAA